MQTMVAVGFRGFVAAVVCLFTLLASPKPTSAEEERPSTGTGQIVVGWIGTGVGAVNLASIPVCYADFYPRDAEKLCVGLSVAFGAVGLGVGIPFLIVGYSKRAEYQRWKAANPTAHEFTKLRLSALEGGGVLGYQSEF